MVVYYVLAVLLVYFSYKSLGGGIRYLAFFKRELAKPRSEYTPFCSVIAPCKGLDTDLEKNLAVLFDQDFPRYEVLFVVDDEEDEAVPTIINLIAGHGKDIEARLLIAPKASGSSQKVENLRKAAAEISNESEILIFVDSDARPNKQWLRNLIAPLEDKRTGASSGYRWFISQAPGFATELRSAWNASIASQLGENMKSNFCWGGSMAISRTVFKQLNIHSKWKGSLSDDFVVTRTVHEAGMPIIHVPACVTATIENCSFREALEFTTRQMKITRVYAEKLWILSYVSSGLFNIVMIASIALILLGFSFWIPLATMLIVAICSMAKVWLRLAAVKLVLTEYRDELNFQVLFQNVLWPVTPALFLYNCLCATFSRTIEWRGVNYKLVSPEKTEVLKGAGE